MMSPAPQAPNLAKPPVPLAALRKWARIVQYPDRSLAAFAIRKVGESQAVCVWFSAGGNAWDGPMPLVVLPRDMGLWGGVEALVDGNDEVHLFLLNDLGSGPLGNSAGEEAHPELSPGEVRLDIWHLQSALKRTVPAAIFYSPMEVFA